MNLSLPNPATSRRLRRASWMLAALLLGSGSLIARPAAGDPPKPADETAYTLKRTYKVGDVDRYKLDLHMKMNVPQLGGDTEIDMQMTLKETTKEVKADGTVITEDIYEKGVITLGGNEIDLSSQMPKLTVTHNKKKVDIKAEGGNEMFSGGMVEMLRSMLEQQEALYPANPVKVGDKWKIEMNTPNPGGEPVKTSADVTFVGTEMLGTQKTLKLKYVTQADQKQSDVKSHGETVLNLDAATGKPLRMTGTSEGEAMGNKFSAKTTMTLITGEEKKPEDGKKPEEGKKPEKADKKP